MKYLFLILTSLNCFASNWMPLSKIQAGYSQAYELESECKKSGESCLDINPEAVKLGYFSIQHTDAVLDDPETEENESVAEINVFTIDQLSYSSYLANKSALAQKEAAISQAKYLRDCGGRVMDLMLVRNQPKGLTIQQVGYLLNTYAPIQLQLSSGSLLTAKAAIQAVSSDGEVVTESDKSALIAEINTCLGI